MAGSHRDAPFPCWLETFPAGGNCDMTNGKAIMCEVKWATYGRIVHNIWAIVLMRGHSQEKEEVCGGGGGGDEDFKKKVEKNDAPVGNSWSAPDWLASSTSHTHQWEESEEHIFTIGEELWRGLGRDTPLPCMHAHTHTHTHIEKTTLALLNVIHAAFAFNLTKKTWSDDVDDTSPSLH